MPAHRLLEEHIIRLMHHDLTCLRQIGGRLDYMKQTAFQSPPADPAADVTAGRHAVVHSQLPFDLDQYFLVGRKGADDRDTQADESDNYKREGPGPHDGPLNCLTRDA
ncbi:hypothetical protein GCM10010255_80470 [Streptomyces coeruleofuscus]|uniref:Uncharacterized protein n=1 Tax=Streptomyces coeruleofuscus TaxID=66879 RepID=A0ABN3JB70_9ACTN